MPEVEKPSENGSPGGAPPGMPAVKVAKPGVKQDLRQEIIKDPYVVAPHVSTYAGQYNAVNKSYFIYWDEALRNSQANTLAFRRDGLVEELMRHRTYPVATLPFHQEPDDPEHPDQNSIAETVNKVVSDIPRLKALFIVLLESIFYGRYGAQMQLGPRKVSGNEWNSVVYTIPINGDKFRYKWDGTPGIVLYGGDISPNGDLTEQAGFLVKYQKYIESSMLGPALYLKNQFLRDRFIIHNFQGFDTDYLFEAEEGQSIFGLGLRSRLYWTWNLRTELLSWMVDALQRVGANGMLYGFYQSGNYPAQQEIISSLKQLVKDNVGAFPLPPGGHDQLKDVIQRIEPSPVGYDIMFQLVQHFEGVMRRTFLGQDLSSESSPTGMGSGTANLQGDVRADVIEYDACLLAETLTNQLVKVILRHNKWKYEGKEYKGDDLPFSLRFVFDINKGDSTTRLQDATALYQMGVPLDQDDVRKAGGFSPPKKKSTILINHELEQQKQMNQAGQPQFNEMNKHLGGLVQEGKKAQGMGMLNKPSSTGEGKPKTSKFESVSRFKIALDAYYDYVGLSSVSRFAKAGDASDCGHERPGPIGGKFTEGNTCGGEGGQDEPSHNTKIEKHFHSVYNKAPEAKKEIDTIAMHIAKNVDHGSKVVQAPVKGKERAIEKIKNDYGGDVSRIKDLARNTIVAPEGVHKSIIDHLKQKGASVKVITADSNPLGYSGINATIPTNAGLTAEIQINSPEMIYSKDHKAEKVLGEEKYNEIRAKTGVPGALGHKLYEEHRSLPLGDPGRDRIELESRLYYEHVRTRMK